MYVSILIGLPIGACLVANYAWKAKNEALVAKNDTLAANNAVTQTNAHGPNPAADGVVRWRLIDLARWIFEEYRISVTKQILSRELRAMGYRKLSARPRHHAQDAAAAAAFKKTSLPSWRLSPRRQAASL